MKIQRTNGTLVLSPENDWERAILENVNVAIQPRVFAKDGQITMPDLTQRSSGQNNMVAAASLKLIFGLCNPIETRQGDWATPREMYPVTTRLVSHDNNS